MRESFEKLNEYELEDSKKLVSEFLLLEKDDKDGILGSIIDKGASFIPRAMRFQKAKKIMGKFLGGWSSKSKKLIDKFSKSINKKVSKIDKSYKEFKKDKIAPLIKEKKYEEAASLLKSQLGDIEKYKKEQFEILDKGIDDILKSYTSSIQKRIDGPGFVLNVELSERGKGELMARWEQLAASQRMKIEEYKLNTLKANGWTTIDNIIAEITSFIEKRKKAEHNKQISGSIKISNLIEQSPNVYFVNARILVSGGRVQISKKGIIVGKSPKNLTLDGEGVEVFDEKGKYQFTASAIKVAIKGTKDHWIRPYFTTTDLSEPVYGDIVNIEDKLVELEQAKDPSKVNPGEKDRWGKAVDFTDVEKEEKGKKEKKDLEKDLDLDIEDDENNESFISFKNFKK